MFKLVVLSCVLAVAASSAIAPLGWAGGHLGLAGGHLGLAGGPLGLAGGHLGLPGAHLGLGGVGWAGHLAAPLAAPVALAAPVHGAYNYRGPLSLAPGQPASILAADGRPLDTLSVNLDRAAHYTARAVDGHGLHHLGKRSAHLLAPGAWSHTARIDVPAARLIAPAHLPIAAPYAVHAPVGHLGLGALGHGALGHGAWGLGAWGHNAALGHLW